MITNCQNKEHRLTLKSFRVHLSRKVLGKATLCLIALLVMGILGTLSYLVIGKGKRMISSQSTSSEESSQNETGIKVPGSLVLKDASTEAASNSENNSITTGSGQQTKEKTSTAPTQMKIVPAITANSGNKDRDEFPKNTTKIIILEINISKLSINYSQSVDLTVDIPPEIAGKVTGVDWDGGGEYSNLNISATKITARFSPGFRSASDLVKIRINNLIGPAGYWASGQTTVYVIGANEYYGSILDISVIPMGLIGTLEVKIKSVSSTAKTITPGVTFPSDSLFVFNKYYGRSKSQSFQSAIHFSDFSLISGVYRAYVELDFSGGYLANNLKPDDYNTDGSLPLEVYSYVSGGSFWNEGTQTLIIPSAKQMLFM